MSAAHQPSAADVEDARRFLGRLRLARRIALVVIVATALAVLVTIGLASLTEHLARAACQAEVDVVVAAVRRGDLPAGATLHAGREGNVVETVPAFVLVKGGAVAAVSPRCLP